MSNHKSMHDTRASYNKSAPAVPRTSPPDDRTTGFRGTYDIPLQSSNVGGDRLPPLDSTARGILNPFDAPPDREHDPDRRLPPLQQILQGPRVHRSRRDTTSPERYSMAYRSPQSRDQSQPLASAASSDTASETWSTRLPDVFAPPSMSVSPPRRQPLAAPRDVRRYSPPYRDRWDRDGELPPLCQAVTVPEPSIQARDPSRTSQGFGTFPGPAPAPSKPLPFDDRRDSARMSMHATNTAALECVGQVEVPGKGLCYMYQDGSICPTHIDEYPVNPNWGTTKAGKPRKRLAQACLQCREKKIRCEPRANGCTQCSKANRECTMSSSNGTSSDTASMENVSARHLLTSAVSMPDFRGSIMN